MLLFFLYKIQVKSHENRPPQKERLLNKIVVRFRVRVLWKKESRPCLIAFSSGVSGELFRLPCALPRARCWRPCPRLRIKDCRRSECTTNKCGWRIATRSGSFWCTASQPRCGRRRSRRTGNPRGEPRGCRRWPTECGSTSTWTRWRWCSWASRRRPGCVSRLALRWHPQTLPDKKLRSAN